MCGATKIDLCVGLFLNVVKQNDTRGGRLNVVCVRERERERKGIICTGLLLDLREMGGMDGPCTTF